MSYVSSACHMWCMSSMDMECLWKRLLHPVSFLAIMKIPTTLPFIPSVTVQHPMQSQLLVIYGPAIWPSFIPVYNSLHKTSAVLDHASLPAIGQVCTACPTCISAMPIPVRGLRARDIKGKMGDPENLQQNQRKGEQGRNAALCPAHPRAPRAPSIEQIMSLTYAHTHIPWR